LKEAEEQRTKPLERPQHRWKNNIRMDLEVFDFLESYVA
jgi:hypothetical protein